jgi:hypothetical protein
MRADISAQELNPSKRSRFERRILATVESVFNATEKIYPRPSQHSVANQEFARIWAYLEFASAANRPKLRAMALEDLSFVSRTFLVCRTGFGLSGVPLPHRIRSPLSTAKNRNRMIAG